MSNFKIFLRDGKLWGNEFPEQPETKGVTWNDYHRAAAEYDSLLTASKGSAMEIINPISGARYEPMEEGQPYPIPAGWKVEYGDDHCQKQHCRSDDVCKEECQYPRKIARLIPDSKVSDSPVIPEGSEKQKFEILLYGEWVELSENQYLHAINNNHYGRINGVEQHRKAADKPTIDDTLSQEEVFNEIFNRYYILINGGYSRSDVEKSLRESFNVTRKP